MFNLGWQGFILISVTLYSISVILQKKILRDEDSNPVAFSMFFQVLTGMVIFVIGLLTSEMGLPNNLSSLLGNIALMILLYGFTNVLVFKSLKLIEASKFTIIFSTRTFFTVLASSIFLGEMLSGKQFLGTLLIFTSVIVVTLKSTKISFTKGDLMALMAAVVVGFAITNDRFLVQNFLVYTYLLIAFILPGILIAVVNPKDVPEIKKLLEVRKLIKIGLLSVIYAFSALTFYEALKMSPNSSQVASVNMTSVIAIVFLSIIFLNERDNLAKKILAAFICFLGLLLVG